MNRKIQFSSVLAGLLLEPRWLTLSAANVMDSQIRFPFAVPVRRAFHSYFTGILQFSAIILYVGFMVNSVYHKDMHYFGLPHFVLSMFRLFIIFILIVTNFVSFRSLVFRTLRLPVSLSSYVHCSPSSTVVARSLGNRNSRSSV